MWLPFRSPPWDSVPYWSIDLETGGLDARRDALLAVGMVPIRGGVIRMRESYRTLVRPEDGSNIDPASVTAHQLVWGELAEAPPIGEVLREIDRRLREGVMLVHFRAVEVRFLRAAFRRHAMRWPSPRVVDTADLLVRLAASEAPRGQAVLDLAGARRARGLPSYAAHDALTDAVATAELFLVLRRDAGARTLRDLL